MSRIAILTANESYRDEISRAIHLAGGECDICSTIRELEEILRLSPHHGLVVDVLTKLKAGDQEDQKRLLEFMEIYPTAQVKWDSHNQIIRTILMVHNESGEDSLDYFVKDICKNAKHRTLRSNRRFDRHLNLLIHTQCDLSDKPSRSTTINLSRGGCYCFLFDPYPVGQNIYAVFNELQTKQPIEAEIIWEIPWGEKMKLPGNGLKFINFTEDQEQELSNYMF